MSARITIVLVDDHQVVREGLRRLLEAEPGFSVVGEVASGLEAVPLAEQLRPHVLITDMMMPGIGGVETARQVTKRSPGTRVVILSMHTAEPLVLEALQAGAWAYVPKDAPGRELVTAIREVSAGRRYLSPPLSATMIEAYLHSAGSRAADPYDSLTDRERVVLQLSAQGASSKEIARHLGISPRTAETHRGNLMRKLGLQNRSALVRFALERGLLPRDSGSRSA